MTEWEGLVEAFDAAWAFLRPVVEANEEAMKKPHPVLDTLTRRRRDD